MNTNLLLTRDTTWRSSAHMRLSRLTTLVVSNSHWLVVKYCRLPTARHSLTCILHNLPTTRQVSDMCWSAYSHRLVYRHKTASTTQSTTSLNLWCLWKLLGIKWYHHVQTDMWDGQQSIGLDWIEQCFTSPPTQYRLYGRRFLQVKKPNQQYQSTEGTNSTHRHQTYNKQTRTQNTVSPLVYNNMGWLGDGSHNQATTPFGYCPSIAFLPAWSHRWNKCQENLNSFPLEKRRRPPGCLVLCGWRLSS